MCDKLFKYYLKNEFLTMTFFTLATPAARKIITAKKKKTIKTILHFVSVFLTSLFYSSADSFKNLYVKFKVKRMLGSSLQVQCWSKLIEKNLSCKVCSCSITKKLVVTHKDVANAVERDSTKNSIYFVLSHDELVMTDTVNAHR